MAKTRVVEYCWIMSIGVQLLCIQVPVKEKKKKKVRVSRATLLSNRELDDTAIDGNKPVVENQKNEFNTTCQATQKKLRRANYVKANTPSGM